MVITDRESVSKEEWLQLPTWRQHRTNYIENEIHESKSVGDPLKFLAAAYVVSLSRTPERLEKFIDNFPLESWPFIMPEHWPAFDGIKKCPKYFTEGGPAYGCLQSHLGIMKRAIDSKWSSPVLHMEDDCQFIDPKRIISTIESCPQDADILYLGCQLRYPTTRIRDGLVKANSGAQRTHAFIVFSFQKIYDLLINCSVHIDWRLEELCRQNKIIAYAAQPVIAVQMSGFSTIRYKQVGAESWDRNIEVFKRDPKFIPVVLLQCDKSIMSNLRDKGIIHAGYWTQNGIDRGLSDLMSGPENQKVKKLKELIMLLRNEAAAFDSAVCALWHPDLSESLVKEAWPQAKISNGDNIDDSFFS